MENNLILNNAVRVGATPYRPILTVSSAGRPSFPGSIAISSIGSPVPIGGGGNPVSNIPVILTISGYTGCGKTTIAKMLVKRLGFELTLLSTTRPPAANEAEGIDYHFTDEDSFMEGVRSGEIVGCEGGYSTYYGVPRAQIEQIISSGRNGVVVAGAAVMDSLRAYFKGRNDVVFRSIYIRMAGTPQEQYEAIAGRIEKRAREEGRDASDRLAKISAGAIEAYDNRARYYDFEVINDDFKAAGQAIRDYAATVQQGLTIEKTERVPIRNTPAIVLARYLFKRLEGKIDRSLSGIDYSSYESVIKGVNELLADDLYEFARVIFNEYHSDPSLEKHLKIIHKHILDVAAGILQTKVALDQLEREKKGIGRLAVIEDAGRAHRNLEAAVAVSGKYSPKHLLFLALMHDLTKLVEWYMHPERTYEALDRFALLKDLPFSEEDKTVYRLATRYHVLLTSCLMPDLSAQSFVNFLNDPQVKEFLAANGNVDIARAGKLLDSIFLLTVADVSPYGAALTNLKYERILAHRNIIFDALSNNMDDWGSAVKYVEANIPQINRQYLGMVLGISDPQMDSKPGIDYYWRIVERRMDELVALGKLTPEERTLIEEKVNLIESSPYPPYNYLARITPDGKIAGGLYENPGVGYFKYLIFGIRLFQLLKQPGRALRLCFMCADGKYIAEKEELQAAALELSRIMGSDSIQPYLEDGSVVLKDALGNKIEGLKILIEENGVEGAREANLVFAGINSNR